VEQRQRLGLRPPGDPRQQAVRGDQAPAPTATAPYTQEVASGQSSSEVATVSQV